ncbi:DUF6212 domain-containing protein [Roseomonas sp. F4]
MSILQIAPADLSALMSGRTAVLAIAGLPGLEGLELPGIELWLATRNGKTFRLHRPNAAAEPAATLPLTLPPPGAVALLARTAEEGRPVAQWWQSAMGQPAPLVLAADAATALPALLARLAAEVQTAQERCVRLERQLAATRVDYEETRIAIASVTRTLGHRPPAPLSLVAALEPSAQRIGVATEGERLFLRQPLARKLEGLAALAVHVGAISAATSGPLRLRVLGEESGRIAAAWTVPMESVTEGWLTLDLPTPLGPDRETAVLEITADVAGPHSLAFSLEPNWVPAAVACGRADGSDQGRALAMRIWTARLGERFVVPAHWDWNEAGASLPLTGVPLAIAPAEREAARILAGNWSGLGQATRLALTGTEPALLALPRVTVLGTDVLRLGWSLQGSAARPVGIGVWVVPAGHPVTGLDSLAAEGSFSGWRDATPGQDGSLTMLLPLALGPQAQIVLAVQGRDAGTEGVLTLTEPSLMAARDPDVLREAQREAAIQRGIPLPPPKPQLGRVELHQHLTGARGYQHLDLVVHGLAGGGEAWPQIRFKLALASDGPLLEFRRGKGWPETFIRWPGTEADKFGPVLRVRRAQMRAFVEGLAHPRDAALLMTLTALLEPIAAEGVGLAKLDADQAALWQRGAEALRQA